MEISHETMQGYYNELVEILILYVPKIVLALITLFVGIKISNMFKNRFKKILISKEVEITLIPFLTGVVGATLKIIVVISVISMVGIKTTSIVTALGAAGLAVGLALQGSLSNFAGGIMILLFRPFKVEEVVEAQGFIGKVTEIQIFHTFLKTFDNKVIILPNGPLANAAIVNYSREKVRVVEWVFSIGYSDDIDKAKQLIIDEIYSDERALNKPGEYFVKVAVLNASSVDIKVRAEVIGDDYWNMFFEKTESVKKLFDANGITIPFPQTDIHVHQVK